MSTEMFVNGADQLIKRIEAKRLQIEHNRERAGRAAANLIKVVMKAEAPYGNAATRDTARKKARTKHLRQTISVRPQNAGGFPGGEVVGFSVAPRSSLAHLVIRGTQARHVTVGGKHAGPRRHETLRSMRELRFHARGFAGPVMGEARALSWSSGGDRVFAASSNPGPMPKNPFVNRAREIAAGEARAIAGAVLFHNVPDPNEGA